MAALDDPGGLDLDRKLAQLRADFGEDIAVYDFGDDVDPLDGMDTLGGALEEDLNEFNDETFGMDAVGKDFDFSGSTAQFLGAPNDVRQSEVSAPTWATMPSLLSNNNYGDRAISPGRNHRGDINLDHDPLLGPNTRSGTRGTTASFSQAKQNMPAPPRGVRIRSLEEIEAELRGNVAVPSAVPVASTAPRALTLEEVEAEMLRNARARSYPVMDEMRVPTPVQPAMQSRVQLAQQIQMQHLAAAQRNRSASPLPSSAMDLAHGRPAHVLPASLPALTHPAHPTHPQHSEWLRLQQQQQQMYTNVVLQQVQLQQLQARAALRSATPLSHRHSPSLSLHGLPPPVTIHPPGSLPVNALFRVSSPNPGAQTAIEDLRSAAEARIQEHERQEVLRRKKAAKIAEMARYNNLMSQGDKDFITRIQVSQLVNPSHGQAGFDPHADDFYFQVYSAIRASRLATQQQLQAAAAERRLSASASGLKGPSTGGREQDFLQSRNNRTFERKLTRRDHAMIRMAQNVQRIVEHARERPKMSQLSLEGALGKIALRTRSAPRQMLQVQPSTSSDDLATAVGGENHPGALSSMLPKTAPAIPGQPAMNFRRVLMSLERLYSTVLEVEQLRRAQPALLSAGGESDSPNINLERWELQYADQKEKIWKQLRVLDPLGISHPHPFVSLMSVAKGKRLLPRIIRLFTREQSLQVLTLLVATFGTLDIVQDAFLLDLPSDTRSAGPYPAGRRMRHEVEAETDLFMNTIIAPMMSIINEISLDLIAGLVSLMIERNDIIYVARSKPGIAFLTLFLSRAEILKNASSSDPDNSPSTSLPPTEEALASWQSVFDQLFGRLSGDFPSLFPSTRAIASIGFGTSHLVGSETPHVNSPFVRPGLDLEDEPVWQLMATLAVSTDADGQQSLVGGLREKVLENVTAAGKNWVSEDLGALKIRNVNLLLHALGLDAGMINLG